MPIPKAPSDADDRVMEPRRKDRRVPTDGWRGRCAVEDEPPLEWTECEVVDVSLIGAGIDIWADSATDLTGSRLLVEIWPPIVFAPMV